MGDILFGLNDEQRDAVTSTEGFVRVMAGAGSGKTRALAHRFAYLVNEVGILPANILCVTFTNKAANEMRRRIRSLTGDNDTGFISTFHGFCVAVLQEDGYFVQYPKSFLVLDNSDIDSMLKIIYEERGLTLRDMTFSNARDMIEIEKCKNRPQYYLDVIAMDTDALKKKYDEAVSAKDVIFYGYLYQQKKCFGLDYNDLIKFTLYIFSKSDEIRLKWQQRLEYIMIDEFQDIDGLQYELMQALCAYHKNLFIVGDPDQTIYSWRGANVKHILDFDKNFPKVKTIMMMKNYRSTPEIIAAANSLIDKNTVRMKKQLIPTLPKGERVVYSHAKTTKEEANSIAERIKKLSKAGVPYGDITILYRAHYIARTIEEGLMRAEIPYTIYSGVQFFDRMEIKDALSYLRLIAYRDDLSFMRIVNTPKRNIGEKRMRFLKEYAAANGCLLYDALVKSIDEPIFANTQARRFVKLIERFSSIYHTMPASELLSAVLNESGYEEALRTEGAQDRLDNLAELKQAVYEYETGCGEESRLEDFLSHVALLTNADAAAAPNAVKLMTVHTAKGLEFPYVFICGLDEGMFPSKRTSSFEAMEEERRLAFVAMTRAEKGLYLSDAEGRGLDGSFRYPSRFVFDIDRQLMDYSTELDPALKAEAQRYISSAHNRLKGLSRQQRLNVGDRVRHDIMGNGVIEDIDEERMAYVVKFDELPTTRKINFNANLKEV
ncbi:MAG: UvrD-helicase domain-containing protein [Clostridiales bacterium]|nr:UvrD-helicase domain-containing protein [Clostridiales bacterium]